MKKLIALILSAILLISLAACKPADPNVNNDPPATTEGEIIIGGNTETPTEDPTENPTEEPTEAPTEPPAPAELGNIGYCAVGIVDAAAGTAKVLGDNGAVAQVKYSGSVAPTPGKIYEYMKNGDVYDLNEVMFINSAYAPWGIRLIDNSMMGTPDQIYTHDGVNETIYDLDENCVIFCRFSETEWRIFRGSDAVKYSDWPCYGYFTNVANPNGGNQLSTVMLICSYNPTTGVEGHADEANTYFFDNEGFGWSDGDLIIE